MNPLLLDQIVQAVLYEGYILYPYRASARKNRQRFTFGRVYPQAYSTAQNGAEPCVMQTECFLRRQAETPNLRVNVRFLHPIAREVGAFPAPLSEWNQGHIPDFEIVPELRVDEQLYQTWQEAMEREVSVLPLPIENKLARTISFNFPALRAVESIRDHEGKVFGVLRRSRQALDGMLEITAAAIDSEVYKIKVRILNLTPVPAAELMDQEAILLRTFASTHTVLSVKGGEFFSLMDPPAAYREAAAACQNLGTWPVLVGDEANGERDTLLSSPIILYDYPRIAPESPGDYCDGTEIDEMLALRIKTMTDEEKFEMGQVDDFARRMLERTETMPEDRFTKLHGTMRDMRSFNEDFFNPKARLAGISVKGIYLTAGDHVRIRPKGRADVMDLALAGRTAVIEAIEQDAEDRVHLALVIDDDPGKDLGLMRQPGHRFFYGPEEVEPLTEGA